MYLLVNILKPTGVDAAIADGNDHSICISNGCCEDPTPAHITSGESKKLCQLRHKPGSGQPDVHKNFAPSAAPIIWHMILDGLQDAL